jgi:ABC-type glycerol-3-phosphate transport system permease component
MKATLAALALVTFLFSWNAFLWPLIVIQSQSRELVQVTIALNVVPGELPNWGAVFAGAVLASAPVLLLFMFLQKYFVRGIATTGLK